MDSELKIDAKLDDEHPCVYHLTVDRDMGGPGAVQPLMQRILGLPGVNGVRREDGRTIIVEKGEADDWALLAKTVTELFRDHFKGNGDAREKGPKGHTRFGATLENLWAYHRQCDRFAVKMKAELQRDRKHALLALAVSSVFGLLCAEHFFELGFGLIGGLAAGVGAYYTKRASSPEREHEWVRARALAEDAKSEAIKFLVRCDPYDKEDAVAKLAERAAKFRQDMADVGEFEELDRAARLTGLPKDWLTMDEYLLERVKDQSDWYGRKSRQLHHDAERLKSYVVMFGVAAAVLGATRFVVGQLPSGTPTDEMYQHSWKTFEELARNNWNLAFLADAVHSRQGLVVGVIRFLKLLGSSSWIPVLTSLTGAITTFQSQNRLDFTSLVYKQTRGKLEAAIAEWTDQVPSFDKPAKQSEYVKRMEKILNQEHAQFSSEFDKGAPGAPGSGFQPQGPPGVM